MKTTPKSKEYILVATLLFWAFLLWFALANLLPQGAWHNAGLLWGIVGAVFFLLVFWGLSMILVDTSAIAIIGWAGVSFMPVLWLRDASLVIVSCAVFIFGVYAYYRAKNDLRAVRSGGLARPLQKMFGLSVTFLAGTIATAAYLWVPTISIGIDKIIPEKYFDRMLGGVEPVLQQVFPEIHKDEPVQDYFIRTGAGELGVEEQKLTTKQKQVFIDSGMRQVRDRFTTIEITPETPIGHIIYVSFISILKQNLAQNQGMFPVAFAFGFFMILRLCAFPLYWCAIAATIGCLRLLVQLGVVELRKIPVEIIGYSLI